MIRLMPLVLLPVLLACEVRSTNPLGPEREKINPGLVGSWVPVDKLHKKGLKRKDFLVIKKVSDTGLQIEVDNDVLPAHQTTLANNTFLNIRAYDKKTGKKYYSIVLYRIEEGVATFSVMNQKSFREVINDETLRGRVGKKSYDPVYLNEPAERLRQFIQSTGLERTFSNNSISLIKKALPPE